MIFDEKTLRKLNALTLIADRVRAGRLRGDRRSSKRGTSIEFADFRNYVPGDDLRRLDWNIYARLDRPFIKLFEDEEDLAVYTLLDGSASMDWGEGDENKFTFGRRLSAALGSIALSNGDAFSFQQLAAAGPTSAIGPMRGNQHTLRYLKSLEKLKPGGKTALNETLLNFTYHNKRAGLVFLISDLLDQQGCQDGLAHLLSRGNQLVVIHILAPEEISPGLTGDLKLIDKEFSSSEEVSLDPVVIDSYRRQVTKWIEENRNFCRSRGISYLHTSTAIGWDQFVLSQMRREGIVK